MSMIAAVRVTLLLGGLVTLNTNSPSRLLFRSVIETKFQELGGEYSAGDDWNSKVCVAGKLATGQNPQSSEALAQEVVKLLA